VKEKLKELLPLLERFKQNITVTKADGDQAENQRRSEFSRYANRSLTVLAVVDDLLRALEEIEKKSRALLEKGAAARFVDKGEDSAEVTRLIERLREAITHYQVSESCSVPASTAHMEGQISQQQAIYDRIADLTVRALLFPFYVVLMTGSPIKSSFDTLLKLHEVISSAGLSHHSLILEQKSPVVKDKLESVMARLDRLCSEDDGNSTLCNETENELRAKLFG